MQTIIEKNGRINIVFNYKPHLVDAVRNIPGRRWDAQSKCWTVPLSSRLEVDRFASRFGFTYANQEKRIEKEDFLIPELPELKIDIPLKMQPFDFQKRGIAYALQKKRLIIGDQPGLGKTMQAIATAVAADAFPCLVICPSSLKLNWQREFHMWTDKKAMLLSDKNKETWPMFAQTGNNLFETAVMNHVFIVNYESLKKYFVASINKPEDAPLRLNHIKFKQTINLFKMVIIDESHRCFPYDTKIMTNKGLIKIGDIVENNQNNLLVLSLNLSSNSVSYNKIKNTWKNDIGKRKLYRIKHNKGELIATEDHKVYTDDGRYKEVQQIKSGEGLYLLRERFYDEQGRKVNGKVLQPSLFKQSNKFKSRSSKTDGQEQKESSLLIEKLCLVWKYISSSCKQQSKIYYSFLHSKLFGKVESSTAGSNSTKSVRIQKGEIKNIRNEANAESGVTENALGANESKQSDSHGRGSRKNNRKIARSYFSFKRWKWSIDRTSDKPLQCVETSKKLHGIFNKNSFSKKFVSFCASLLQSGYWNRIYKTCNRSGWFKSQNKEMEILRSSKNRNIELVRVESCEVYESGSESRYSKSSRSNQIVYDLEIEGNHNYFAEGILVHNCKEIKTAQSKYVKGICHDKEWILALTGTPVVNKPKDLISQLAIIDRLNDFGGYQGFTKQYCDDTYGNGSNLKELNYLLSKNCFYRRDKSDVLKDLPAKMRQVVLCDIATKKEYADALHDLEEYLKKYKHATDDQVARSMKGEVMVRIGILKNISARGKIADVVEYVNDVIDSGEKIVLFTHLHDVQNNLKKHFPDALTILGDDDGATRQRNVDLFQNNPAKKLIICSIKAAGVGITLTAASRVAFVELPWHPADSEQCEDRCHRIGQVDSVQCTYFLGKNTIDEWIYQIINNKREVANTITGAKDVVEQSVIDGVINLFTMKL